jgi:hypothetical protein
MVANDTAPRPAGGKGGSSSRKRPAALEENGKNPGDGDNQWLFYSRDSLRTREMLDAGFANCMMIDADAWRDVDVGVPLLELVAEDLGYAFGFANDIESFEAENKQILLEEILEGLRWGETDVLIVICDASGPADGVAAERRGLG